MIPYASPRQRYVSTGKVNWPRFVPLAALALLTAAVLAFLLKTAFFYGTYIVVMMPLLAAFAVAAMVIMAIALGHCRNRWVAMLLALVAGAVLYLGYYHLAMIHHWGGQYLWRFDRLPTYIWFRLNTDTSSTSGQAPKPPDFGGNLIDFVFEATFIALILGLAAWSRSGRAFCERCRRWKSRSSAIFEAGNGRAIAQMLETGALATLARMPRSGPNRKRGHTAVLVEFCPQSAEPCDVILTVKDVSVGGGFGATTHADLAIGRTRLPRTILNPDEIAAVAPVFPEMPAPPSAAAVPAPAPVASPSRIAPTITPLPHHDTHIITPWALLVGNLLTLSILLAFLAGLGLSGLGIAWASGAFKSPIPFSGAIAIAVIGGILATISGAIGVKNPSFIGNRYLLARARRIIRRRPHRIVDPDDPDAVFVEIVPRKNWYRLMLETATDIGFIKIDHSRREILFEGDRERHRIPADAIESAAVEPFTPGNGSITYFATVLRSTVAGQTWESPYCVRATAAKLPAGFREIAARDLHGQIAAILPDARAAVAPSPGTPGEGWGEGASESAEDSVAVPTPAIPLPPPPPGERIVDLLVRWWRVLVFLLVILVGVSAGFLKNLSTRARGLAPAATIGNAGRGPTLAFTITNIRSSVRFATTAPYIQSGGDWTAFDCRFVRDPEAIITVAVAPVDKARGGAAEDEEEALPVHFSKAAFFAADRAAGERVLALFDKEFSAAPKPRSPQPLAPFQFSTAVLGEKLARRSSGFRDTGRGTWTASKWFLNEQGYDSEVYFNYDLAAGKGEFADKDPDYDEDLVAVLALALRDGPRPPRTPQNDSNFSPAGPRIINLTPIPDSEHSSIHFLGGDLALLTRLYRKPSSVLLIDLRSPMQKRELIHSDESIDEIVPLDLKGEKIACLQVARQKANVFDPNAPRTLWLHDATAGAPRRLEGAWDKAQFFLSDQPPPPGGRFLAIGLWNRSNSAKPRQILHFLDLSTGRTTQSEFGLPARVVAWIERDGKSRALVRSARALAQEVVPQFALIEPISGERSEWTGPLPPAADPELSPDGLRRFKLEPRHKLDIIDTATSQSRAFVFHEDDQRFAEPGAIEWLSPRYLEFNAVRQAVIDIDTLKMSYLGDQNDRFNFSPDFRWAWLMRDKQVFVGQVETAASTSH